MTRDKRRQLKKKFFKKALAIARGWYLGSQYEIKGGSEDWIERTANKIQKNRKPCSCRACCNPRHSKLYKGKGKKTVQELIFEDYVEE